MIEGIATSLRVWAPAVLWMAAMFMLSTDLGSASNTSRFLEPLVRFFVPQVSPDAFALIHLLVRKAAHLTEYAILAVLVRRGLRAGVGRGPLAWRWGPELFAWLWAVAFAASDEVHQSLVDSRGPSAGDVAIDAAGAAIGLAIVVLASRVGRAGVAWTTSTRW